MLRCNECITDCKAPVAQVVTPLLLDSRKQKENKSCRVEQLTLESSDQHISILDELLDEFIGLLQLYFMVFEALPEVRAVQKRVTELQRRESHRFPK